MENSYPVKDKISKYYKKEVERLLENSQTKIANLNAEPQSSVSRH